MKCFVTLCLFAAVTAQYAQGGEPIGASALDNQTAERELLGSDLSWCGPRILYFFMRFRGIDCSLEDVVRRCNSDAKGMTSMKDLVDAADGFGLDPTGLQCSLSELTEGGAHAIVCMRAANQDANVPYHFVGLIPTEVPGTVLVVDPSSGASAKETTLDALSRNYSGYAIALGTRQFMRPAWATTFTVCVTSAAALSAVGLWRWRRAVPKGYTRP